jgi:hypothetical protein
MRYSPRFALTVGVIASACVSDDSLNPVAPLPTAGVVTVSSELLDFGVVDAGTRSPETVLTVTNTGATTIRVPKVVISNPVFVVAVNGNGCEVNLGPKATCDVRLVFAPTQAGAPSANLTFEEAKGAIKSVTLRGIGRESIALNVKKDGTGTGVVKSEAMGQIDCGPTCSVTLPKTDKVTTVTLSAIADEEDSVFTGWSGSPCSGTEPCAVAMSEARSVTATFRKTKVRLTVKYTLDQVDPSLTVAVAAPSETGVTCAPGAACTQLVKIGDVATVTPAASTAFRFSGASCMEPTKEPCKVTMNSDQTVVLRATKYNYAFVTSARYKAGALGGRNGADMKCTERAAAAGLPGRYQAWLATGVVTGSGGGRADVRFGDGGYIRTDGKVFARNKLELQSAKIRHPLWLDESKVKHTENLNQEKIHTGAYNSGVGYKDDPCVNWSNIDGVGAPAGATQGQTRSWTFANANDEKCDAEARLACLGTDLATEVPLDPVPATGRRAFVSAGTILPNQGLMNFDALCQSEARAVLPNALPNAMNFKALVATTANSAKSRFVNATGGNWFTVDGVPLADSPAMFFLGNLNSGITQDASGNITTDGPPTNNIVGAQNVLTGYLSGDSPAMLGTLTCDNWSTAAPTAKYGVGNTALLSPTQTFGMHGPIADGLPKCEVPGRLYCLED